MCKDDNKIWQYECVYISFSKNICKTWRNVRRCIFFLDLGYTSNADQSQMDRKLWIQNETDFATDLEKFEWRSDYPRLVSTQMH